MDPEKKKRKKSRLRSANWTGSQTRLLLKLVKKKQKELGKVNFDRKVWNQTTEALNKKSCPSHKIEQVKMRIRTLKKKFNDYRMLVQMPGWGWDSERKLPTAPSETCWHEIIESNKSLSKCRTKAFPWYKLVAELSGAEVPAGENEPSGSMNDTMEEEKMLLLEAGTEQNAGANSADDVSSSSGKRTRHELVPAVLQEDLQNNNAEEELPEVGITQTQNCVRNANWTETEHPNKQLEVLVAATPSICMEAINYFKLVAEKLVKVRSQFKLSRSDFIDMSVVVRDELTRELFMKQEGKELLDWIKDSLETYREQRKAHQGMQQPANQLFFMPHYPYPPGGPYTPQPDQGMQQPANQPFFMPRYPYPPGGPYMPQPHQGMQQPANQPFFMPRYPYHPGVPYTPQPDQGMQQPANRPFFMPRYPYPPGGPYMPQPQQPM